MNAESLDLLLSFVSLLVIPCAIVFGTVAVASGVFGKGWPRGRDLLLSCSISVGITVLITLLVCVVFKWTGFFDGQFYRPSKLDYERAEGLGLKPEVVTFASADGTKLQGWFLSADDSVGTVICFHGSDRNITDAVKNTHWLTRYGLNVFLFDYRGYGASEGVPSRKGVVDDSVAAIGYVVSRGDVDSNRIVLFGQSMGGQLALNAASVWRGAPIRLVIAESTYARHSYHISDKLGRLPFLWLVKWGAWLLTSDDFSGESAVAKLESTPVLLIHGSADKGVSPYHSDRLFAAAAEPKELWRYEGYGHLQIFTEQEQQQRLAQYILDNLGRHALDRVADGDGGEPGGGGS